MVAGRQAGADEVLRLAGGVDGHHQAKAGAGQRAGAVDDLAQDGLEVEAALMRSTAAPRLEMRSSSISLRRRSSSGVSATSPACRMPGEPPAGADTAVIAGMRPAFTIVAHRVTRFSHAPGVRAAQRRAEGEPGSVAVKAGRNREIRLCGPHEACIEMPAGGAAGNAGARQPGAEAGPHPTIGPARPIRPDRLTRTTGQYRQGGRARRRRTAGGVGAARPATGTLTLSRLPRFRPQVSQERQDSSKFA